MDRAAVGGLVTSDHAPVDLFVPFAIMPSMKSRLLQALASALMGVLAAAATGCVMKRTVTQDGAVVSQGYVVERPLETMHNLETTGPDEDDD